MPPPYPSPPAPPPLSEGSRPPPLRCGPTDPRQSSRVRSASATSKALSPELGQKVRDMAMRFNYRAPNFLSMCSVQEIMYKRFLSALHLLHLLLTSAGRYSGTLDDVDAGMADMVEDRFFAGRVRAEAQVTYAAFLALCPQPLKGAQALPRTVRAMRAWQRFCPATTRAPAPWMVVAAMAHALVMRGLPTEALMTLVMFSAYLRPCEAWNLHAQDIVPPCPPMSWTAAINLHPEERGVTSKTFATNESILMDHPQHTFLSLELVGFTAAVKTGKLFKFTIHHCNSMFRSVQIEIGLPVRYVLYQLRPGGLSADRLDGIRPLAEIKQRGR